MLLIYLVLGPRKPRYRAGCELEEESRERTVWFQSSVLFGGHLPQLGGRDNVGRAAPGDTHVLSGARGHRKRLSEGRSRCHRGGVGPCVREVGVSTQPTPPPHPQWRGGQGGLPLRLGEHRTAWRPPEHETGLAGQDRGPHLAFCTQARLKWEMPRPLGVEGSVSGSPWGSGEGPAGEQPRPVADLSTAKRKTQLLKYLEHQVRG